MTQALSQPLGSVLWAGNSVQHEPHLVVVFNRQVKSFMTLSDLHYYDLAL